MRTKPVQRESLPARIQDAIGDFASRSAARFAVLVFAGLVGVFTVLFSLPVATTSGEQAPFVDALFTAVSVICVTGLSTVDMATFWSPVGHVFVFVGVEIGGIGVLTLASILGPDHQPPARAAAEAARGRRREPVAHPQGSDRRGPGGPARRDRRACSPPSRSACSSSRPSSRRCCSRACCSRASRRGMPPSSRSTRRRWRSRTPGFLPDERGTRAVRPRPLVPARADDRRHVRGDRVPGDLRAEPQPAATASAGRCT